MGVFQGAWTWLTTAGNWTGDGGALALLGEHLYLTAVCLGIAAAVALPTAVWLGHLGRGGPLAINLSNVGRAVPTFAVLVLLMLTPLATVGGGDLPTIVALVLFAIPPLLTNAYVGMREADREVVEAARGMGMSGGQLLFRVELPLAYPLLMTGVRSAAVQVVATATLAAMVGGGGLGRIITAGFNTYDTAQVVAGAVLVAVLALLVELAMIALGRVLDPMRGRRGARRTNGRSGEPADEDGHDRTGAAPERESLKAPV
ncbi:ABC transporter permease [Streptomyces sp. DSM 42041]|uniref:ABC transporter permease n=1 Tax=Streptomyces hazeniae TaxID=3075538 RepID=A0ABU2P1K7_9ACTN|nr:ABC transporter permease [Streptomyces sp. DSM 42041]MDT0381798.1 ABC transporter permease [Streptomyces sp. DSM 42041]